MAEPGAEVGRQPWIVYNLLRTAHADLVTVADVGAGIRIHGRDHVGVTVEAPGHEHGVPGRVVAEALEDMGASDITMKPVLTVPPVPAAANVLITSPESRSGWINSSILRIC